MAQQIILDIKQEGSYPDRLTKEELQDVTDNINLLLRNNTLHDSRINILLLQRLINATSKYCYDNKY